MITALPLTGYANALDAAHESAGAQAVVAGPRGYAYATPGRLDTARRWLSNETSCWLQGGTPIPVELDPRGATRHWGVSCVQVAGGASGTAAAGHVAEFRRRLLEAHTGILEQTTDAVVHELSKRTAEGSSLLGRQLVQAGVADARLVSDEVRYLLETPVCTDAAVCATVFARLVRTGRAVLRLLGAASFLTDGPGGALLTAEQVGTLYLAQDMRS